MTAFVNVAVVPLPFKSGVSTDKSPDWQTANVAFSNLQQALRPSLKTCGQSPAAQTQQGSTSMPVMHCLQVMQVILQAIYR